MTTPSKTLIAGLDIETTGIDQADGHRIIEIAIAIHDLDSQARVGSFVARVNPQRPIDPDAQAVHKISFDMLAHEPLWGAVAPKVSAILSRCHYVVAHNGEGFDMPFVCAELQREGCTVPRQFKLVDTMLQARWATPDGSLPNLGALCFACNVPYDAKQAHGALYDVDVMLQAFFSQLEYGFFHLPKQPWQFKPPVSRKKEKK